MSTGIRAYEPYRIWVERKIRNMVAQGSGLRTELVIKGEQNAPLPQEPCAVVTQLRDVRHGRPEWISIDDQRFGGVYSRWGSDNGFAYELAQEWRRATYDIQWIGEPTQEDESNTVLGPDEYAQNFVLWVISSPGILAQQRRRRDETGVLVEPNIILRAHTEVRNLTKLAGPSGGFPLGENRYGMDITVDYQRVVQSDVGWFDKVDITIDHDPPEPAIQEEVDIRADIRTE